MGKKRKGNGEGTLYTNSNTGLLVGQYYSNGRRKSVYQKKNEKITDFKVRFNKIIASINDGSYIEKNNQTLYGIIESFINQKYEDNQISPRSYDRYKHVLIAIRKTCSNFIDKPIQKVIVADVALAKKDIKKYSKSSISKMWELLYKGFKLGVSRRIIMYNIMDDEILSKPISNQETVKKKALTSKELEKLNNVLDTTERHHKYRNIVKLQLQTRCKNTEKF